MLRILIFLFFFFRLAMRKKRGEKRGHHDPGHLSVRPAPACCGGAAAHMPPPALSIAQCPRSDLYIGASCGCARAASSGVDPPAARAAVKELQEDPPVVLGTGSRAAVRLGLRGQIPGPSRTNPHRRIISSYQRLGASARQDAVTPGAGRGGLGGGFGIARRYATLEGDAGERCDQRVCRRSVPRIRHRSPADCAHRRARFSHRHGRAR